jgi:hypothetical protein
MKFIKCSSLVSGLIPKGDNRSWQWHRSLRPAAPKPIGSAPRWLAEFGYQHFLEIVESVSEADTDKGKT